MHKKLFLAFALAGLVTSVLALPDTAVAGTGGAAFDPIWQWLSDNIQGTLGRIIAAAMILVGIVGGIARQSLMAFALGIGGGMGLYNSPPVIESLMSATLPVLSVVSPAAQTLSAMGIH